jgi:hypothetical protein
VPDPVYGGSVTEASVDSLRAKLTSRAYENEAPRLEPPVQD